MDQLPTSTGEPDFLVIHSMTFSPKCPLFATQSAHLQTNFLGSESFLAIYTRAGWTASFPLKNGGTGRRGFSCWVSSNFSGAVYVHLREGSQFFESQFITRGFRGRRLNFPGVLEGIFEFWGRGGVDSFGLLTRICYAGGCCGDYLREPQLVVHFLGWNHFFRTELAKTESSQ